MGRSVHTESNTRSPSVAHRWKWLAGPDVLSAEQLIVKLKEMIKPYRPYGVSYCKAPDDIDLPSGILPGSICFGRLLDRLEKDDLPDDSKIQLLLRLTPGVFKSILRNHMRQFRRFIEKQQQLPRDADAVQCLMRMPLPGSFDQGKFRPGSDVMTTIDE